VALSRPEATRLGVDFLRGKPAYSMTANGPVRGWSVTFATVRVGSVEVRDVPKPSPGPRDVLVRVCAATVNRTDTGELLHPALIRLLTGAGFSRRRVLGLDFAGTVEAVGAEASLFKPGDRVFGMCPSRNDGAQAEFLCMPETGAIAAMPGNLRFDEVVVCEGAYYALPIIEHFALRPGHRVLIYGASGAIGTAALQFARERDAHVTAVVESRHLDLVRKLGADEAIDCTTDAFEALDRSYDFVLDAVGKLGLRRWRRWLKPGGVFAATDRGPWSQNLLFILWSKLTGSGRVVVPLAKRGSAPSFVAAMRDRLASGRYVAIVDRSYPLADIGEAYRYVQTGRKTGIVVVDVATEEGSTATAA